MARLKSYLKAEKEVLLEFFGFVFVFTNIVSMTDFIQKRCHLKYCDVIL